YEGTQGYSNVWYIEKSNDAYYIYNELSTDSEEYEMTRINEAMYASIFSYAQTFPEDKFTYNSSKKGYENTEDYVVDGATFSNVFITFDSKGYLSSVNATLTSNDYTVEYSISVTYGGVTVTLPKVSGETDGVEGGESTPINVSGVTFVFYGATASYSPEVDDATKRATEEYLDSMRNGMKGYIMIFNADGTVSGSGVASGVTWTQSGDIIYVDDNGTVTQSTIKGNVYEASQTQNGITITITYIVEGSSGGGSDNPSGSGNNSGNNSGQGNSGNADKPSDGENINPDNPGDSENISPDSPGDVVGYQVSQEQWEAALKTCAAPAINYFNREDVNPQYLENLNLTLEMTEIYNGVINGESYVMFDYANKRCMETNGSETFYYWQEGDVVYRNGDKIEDTIENIFGYLCAKYLGAMICTLSDSNMYYAAIFDFDSGCYSLDMEELIGQTGSIVNLTFDENGTLVCIRNIRDNDSDTLNLTVEFKNYGTTSISIPDSFGNEEGGDTSVEPKPVEPEEGTSENSYLGCYEAYCVLTDYTDDTMVDTVDVTVSEVFEGVLFTERYMIVNIIDGGSADVVTEYIYADNGEKEYNYYSGQWSYADGEIYIYIEKIEQTMTFIVDDSGKLLKSMGDHVDTETGEIDYTTYLVLKNSLV
ncbi:MAG: hypothetical protein ACI4MC_01410, partial [Candidatus Coproplasma sp.]